MVQEAAGLVAEGRQALREGDWTTARETFRAALEIEETAEGLFGLGEALWWDGQIPAAIEHRERAYATAKRGSDPVTAARIALRLAVDYRSNIGNIAASEGWLSRGASLVRDRELVPLEGWVRMVEGFVEVDPTSAEEHARAALEDARASGDVDLELSTLSVLGSALIAQGRADEGAGYIDEAMAGSLSGESPSRHTTVFASCNMIKSCTSCADIERAVQWIHAADRFMQDYGCAFLYATCRTQYGSILMATGEWSRAEVELVAALDASRSSLPTIHADAVAALASLRVAQGRLEEAERLLAGFEGHPATVPVLARLHLVRDRPAAAAAAVNRRLREIDDGLESGLLLELLGETEVFQGDAAAAAERGRWLVEFGASQDCRTLIGRGQRLRGRAATATGDTEAARDHLEAALAPHGQLGLTYEVARTRLLLAGALEEDQPEVAVMEAESAFAVLDGLGAQPEADAAAALLRRLGVTAARRGSEVDALLTDRELEVLELVSEGLSNPDIAERLYLSRRTVEHHVGNILAKLGARTRTEAARRFLAGPSSTP